MDRRRLGGIGGPRLAAAIGERAAGRREREIGLDSEADQTLAPSPQPLANFGANDYLGLAADPRLTAAAHQAALAEGWGAGASPLITGHSRAHRDLELRLAEFMQTESGAGISLRIRRE